ncbi:MAG TPA: ABC transporter ATP-binding protein [Sphingomonas sp.]|uniref:ABC transporter ATP-binding protein n=1 Tax=Sphingomonas sp. TaxID=28214 RepID=UPI002D13DF97|nr:ABC transporter ATP-binding protein [Sphingomonas sp.]HMI20208.1 ABC transporter ATP-binding protein [Sphingomonas sp.]
MIPLEIEHLSVRYGATTALDDVSLRVGAGEIVALVGPSGSGKSTLAAAAMYLLPSEAIEQGVVRIEGEDVTTLPERRLRALRGGRVGIVFQEPATALNTALPIGRQIGEVLELHTSLGRAEIEAEVSRLLIRVGLDLSRKRYPHTLSGGQRQRVAIAMAIAAQPVLLLADEPTASLDPVAQAEITTLLLSLVRERGMGLLLVTHDITLARRIADRVVTLDQGRIGAPAAPAGELPERAARAGGDPLLTFAHVTRTYPGKRARVAALTDISFALGKGETLAVIGESGSGKSTLARLALGLDRPDAGTVTLDGNDWASVRGPALRGMLGQVQAVFQDPAASFDPRQTVGRIVAEPLHLLGPLPAAERVAMVAQALTQVGLPSDAVDRLPQAFSGGQRQRIAIARALIRRPDLIVFDEALSALDPELRDEMVALLQRLQEELGLTYLFIAHDMDLVRRMADRVLVLRHGRAVALGLVAAVLDRPDDPYLAALAALSE